jgi:fucose 4-O-acetylase-like acetyltransferase
MHLFWSIDVSLVSLFFYAFAFYLKDVFFSDKHKYDRAIIFVLFVSHVVCSFYLPNKIDMYRSVYGNVLLFLFNASIGIGFWVLLFKKLKRFNFLAFLGKNTLPILAVHTRALTVIKLFLLLFWSSKSFAFNEYEKIILVVLQLLIIYPVILFINKKTPVLNGKIKVVEARV